MLTPWASAGWVAASPDATISGREGVGKLVKPKSRCTLLKGVGSHSLLALLLRESKQHQSFKGEAGGGVSGAGQARGRNVHDKQVQIRQRRI